MDGVKVKVTLTKASRKQLTEAVLEVIRKRDEKAAGEKKAARTA